MLITPKLSTFFFIENTTYDIILTRIGSEVMNNYYQMSEKETLKKLKTTKEGLTTKEAVKRIKLYGKNSLPKSKQKSYIQVFFSEFKNPICYILLITLTLSFIIGEYVDAIFILFVVLIDALLGSVQEYKSSKSAEALKKIVKVEAKVLRDNKEVIIESSDLTIGDIVYLESGNIVPADLRLLVVNSLEVDESILTGESIPREKHTKKITKEVTINDRTNMCYLGTNITRGRAIGIVTSISKDTEIGSIAKEVLNSSRTLTPLQIRMNKFTKDLSLIAAVLAIIVTFILYIKGYTAKEIFFLVIALSVSAIPEGLPVVITLALSISSDKMAKKNVIVKKLNAVEALGSTTLIASDKTGTLTKGVFKVTAVHPESMSEAELLDVAAAAESYSNHPIAESIIAAHKGHIDRARIGRVTEHAGMGVEAVIDGRDIFAGNGKLMELAGANPHDCHISGTVIHISEGKNYYGHIVISDELKPDSKTAVAELKALGITQTVMLTGDRKEIGEAVGKELGLDEVCAELLPDGKVNAVEKLLNQKMPLAFVGDGINDAPVLARADIGIAMGGMGSDAAIEAADVVLMDDKPSKLPEAVKIARKTMSIVLENIIFALAVKAVVLVLGAAGIAGMWLAIFADVGVTVIAVLNAIRAMRT